MPPPLERLVYRSTSRTADPREHLDAILAVSRIQNARREITGVLGFHDGHYIQVLEGAPADLDELVTRIERDPRHSELVVLHRSSTPRRLFPDWSMGWVDVMQDQGDVAGALDDGPRLIMALFQLFLRGQTVCD